MGLIFLASVMCVSLNFVAGSNATVGVTDPCLYKLVLFDDGPAVLDVPVSVSAVLECADDEEYLFVFEDDQQRKIVVPGHQGARASFTFSDQPGLRNVKVSAYIRFMGHTKVASKNITVEVHEYISGQLEFSSETVDSGGELCVPSDSKTNVTVALRCPGVLLQDAEFSYSWSIGETRYTSSHNYLVHRFSDPGPQSVRAAVVARVPSYDGSNVTRFKWGYFNSQILVKSPFKNINISGNTYLHHGQLLNLDISCSGSGPVDYCWKVLPSAENHTNLSCTDPVTVAECSFPIIYYFRESGKYHLTIFVDNAVSRRQRDVEIHIYDVSLRPQLSTIIIPLVCTVLALLIVATAVVIHLRRTKNYDVETADFDFIGADEPDGSVTVETSWEYMRRTFLLLLRMPCVYYSTQVKLTNYGTVVGER